MFFTGLVLIDPPRPESYHSDVSDTTSLTLDEYSTILQLVVEENASSSYLVVCLCPLSMASGLQAKASVIGARQNVTSVGVLHMKSSQKNMHSHNCLGLVFMWRGTVRECFRDKISAADGLFFDMEAPLENELLSGRDGHPLCKTQLPSLFAKALLACYTLPGEHVAEFFGGSAIFAQTAFRMGRSATVFEKDRRIFSNLVDTMNNIAVQTPSVEVDEEDIDENLAEDSGAVTTSVDAASTKPLDSKKPDSLLPSNNSSSSGSVSVPDVSPSSTSQDSVPLSTSNMDLENAASAPKDVSLSGDPNNCNKCFSGPSESNLPLIACTVCKMLFHPSCCPLSSIPPELEGLFFCTIGHIEVFFIFFC